MEMLQVQQDTESISLFLNVIYISLSLKISVSVSFNDIFFFYASISRAFMPSASSIFSSFYSCFSDLLTKVHWNEACLLFGRFWISCELILST